MWPTGNKRKSGCFTGLRSQVRVQRLPKQLEIEGGKSQKGGSHRALNLPCILPSNPWLTPKLCLNKAGFQEGQTKQQLEGRKSSAEMSADVWCWGGKVWHLCPTKLERLSKYLGLSVELGSRP